MNVRVELELQVKQLSSQRLGYFSYVILFLWSSHIHGRSNFLKWPVLTK